MGSHRGAGSVGPLGRTGLSGVHATSFNGDYVPRNTEEDRI